jgi:uncharacterized protein with HEPN domain
MDDFTKKVYEHAIDGITDILEYTDKEDTTDVSELHHRLFNEDYFIIGHYRAEEALEGYGIFAAIDTVKEYEVSNFGEFTTRINSEAIANMLAYIIGEEILHDSEALADVDDIDYNTLVQLRDELTEAIN